MKRLWENRKRSVTDRKLAKVAILDYRRRRHQSSNLTQDLHRGDSEARGRHAMPPSSIFISFLNIAVAARCGAWSSFPGLLHHHLHRRRRRRHRRLSCLSCGIQLAGCLSASNEAFFSAERIFRGRKLFAAAYSGLIGFVPPFSASSSSSPNSHLLANTHKNVHLHLHNHTPSHRKKKTFYTFTNQAWKTTTALFLTTKEI